MKGWRWSRLKHDWKLVDIKLPKDFGKTNANKTETLLLSTEMSEHGKKRCKFMRRVPQEERPRL